MEANVTYTTTSFRTGIGSTTGCSARLITITMNTVDAIALRRALLDFQNSALADGTDTVSIDKINELEKILKTMED